MTIDEFVKNVTDLEKRLLDDQIVTPDIKNLASAVRVLAEGFKDSQEVISELQGAVIEAQDALIELKKRPTKNITVNYGK